MRRMAVAVAVVAPLVAALPTPSTAAVVTPSVATAAPAGVVVPSRSDRGSLRVVAKGVPQGRSAKITVAGKKYRKKVPRVGKLRNLRPGTYRVWATPIVSDGGTAAVPDLPVRVKVRVRKPAVLRLTYSWNPKNDSYPPGPARNLSVTDRGEHSVALAWTNGTAPDLQGVEVRRKQGSQAPASLDDGHVVDVDGLSTVATDTGLQPHTTYSYSVFMVDVAGNASKPASVTTRTSGQAATVTAGNSHTCALLKDTGSPPDLAATAGADLVECWGENAHGQLGDGSTTDAAEPVGVGLADVVEISAGGDTTCARQQNGAVWCWGRNDYGQLGRGSTSDGPLPAPVNLFDATDISVGGDHACAVLTSGAVRCWGRNDHGQLGVTKSDHEDMPVTVAGLQNVVSVTAGYAHTCAVLTGGSVRCWGRNDRGQLGVNSRVDSSTPVRPVLGPVAAMTAGVFHTCALLADQTVSCWGGNDYGQVGDGTTSDRLTPTSLGLSATAVSAGAYHSCAALTGGATRCWGRNSSGRLGDGTATDRLQPTRVTGLTAASSIAAGGYHSCAVVAAGTLCWGFNGSGQLGTGTTTTSLRPTAVWGL
jgi:alpha-tubulin suppressor-like RCC1 family protein